MASPSPSIFQGFQEELRTRRSTRLIIPTMQQHLSLSISLSLSLCPLLLYVPSFGFGALHTFAFACKLPHTPPSSAIPSFSPLLPPCTLDSLPCNLLAAQAAENASLNPPPPTPYFLSSPPHSLFLLLPFCISPCFLFSLLR